MIAHTREPSKLSSHCRRSRAWLLATLAVGIGSLGLGGYAHGLTTKSFLLDSDEELSAGEMDGTAVHSDGSVTVGAQVRRIELPEVPVAWSFARGKDGSIYVGSGYEGRVYRLRGDAVTVFAETKQLLVSSLAFGSDGTLYAGTLPEGRIFAIDSGGESEELVRPGEAEHVWDLTWDARRGRLFAATGPNGKVFAVSADGRVEEFFDGKAGHIMSLALDGDVLYAGTSDEAHVLRLHGPGQAEVVYDFPGNEITAIAARDGELAVAANEFPDPPRVRGSSKKAGPAQRPKPGEGQLWRVGADGRAEQVFAFEDGHFADVELAEDGTVFAGTGNEGRIFRVARDRTSAMWIDVDERQVLALSLTGPEPFFLTGDTGAIYRVAKGTPDRALWTSDVLDAEFNARFGELRFRGEGALAFQTRSGNTKEPDDTWSGWSAPMTSSGPIRSAAARFLQVRARFRSPDAVIRAVEAYYLPRNQRPVVANIRIKDGKEDELPDPSSEYELTWDTTNPDDDKLRYRLRFRNESQDRYRSILREDEVLTEDEYEWETSGIPDGWYIVQVEASDELENPADLTLRGTDESEPIRIDNHAPQIRELRARPSRLTGRVVDSLGPIARLEYAVDGDRFHVFFPVDQLLDTADERFDLDLSDLEPGEHIVAVRAYDAGGNPVTAERIVTVR